MVLSISSFSQDSIAYTQQRIDFYDPNEEIIDFPDQTPSFPGGQSAMDKWFEFSIRYPWKAREQRIEGSVMVSFVVEKNGKLSEFKIESDNQIFKDKSFWVRKMPRWEPGTQNGLPVRTRTYLHIKFMLI